MKRRKRRSDAVVGWLVGWFVRWLFVGHGGVVVGCQSTNANQERTNEAPTESVPVLVVPLAYKVPSNSLKSHAAATTEAALLCVDCGLCSTLRQNRCSRSTEVQSRCVRRTSTFVVVVVFRCSSFVVRRRRFRRTLSLLGCVAADVGGAWRVGLQDC